MQFYQYEYSYLFIDHYGQLQPIDSYKKFSSN